MKLFLFSFCAIGIIISTKSSFAFIAPNVSLTPGVLCSASDSNFSHYDYPEHIARCARNVTTDEKLKIAANYGNIPQADWPNYEFDHLIPLCAGGSDDINNLWPQPIAEAHKKDVLENDICIAMKAGTLTQTEAIAKVHAWFNSLALSENLLPTYMSEIKCTAIDNNEVVNFSIMGYSQISNVVVSLKEAGEEHEVIQIKSLLQGTQLTKIKSDLLKGLVRYELNGKSKDHFELYLPPTFTDEQAKIIGYLKIGFDDTYPKLTKLICE